jgi:hypothetical protein
MKESAVNKSIRMFSRTIDCVERLREIIHSPSFSDTVKSSIEVFDMLINSVEKGDKILIEDKNGKQRQILIYGVSR